MRWGRPARAGRSAYFRPRDPGAPQRSRDLDTPSSPLGIGVRGPAHQRGQAAGDRAFAVALLSPQPRDSGKRTSSELPRWPDPAPQKSAWDGHSILPSTQHFIFFLKKKKMFSK